MKYNECPACGSMNIVHDSKGQTICKECGVISAPAKPIVFSKLIGIRKAPAVKKPAKKKAKKAKKKKKPAKKTAKKAVKKKPAKRKKR